MDNKEEILRILEGLINNVKERGAISIFVSINYGKKSGNAFYGSIMDLATSLASQGGDIEESTIPKISKAVELAKIMF